MLYSSYPGHGTKLVVLQLVCLEIGYPVASHVWSSYSHQMVIFCRRHFQTSPFFLCFRLTESHYPGITGITIGWLAAQPKEHFQHPVCRWWKWTQWSMHAAWPWSFLAEWPLLNEGMCVYIYTHCIYYTYNYIYTYIYIYVMVIHIYIYIICIFNIYVYVYIYVYNYYICIYVYHIYIYIYIYLHWYTTSTYMHTYCSLCICECPFYDVDPYAQLDPVHYRVPRPASEFERKSFVRFPRNNRKGPSTHQMQTFLGHNLMTFHVYESMSDESWDPS